MAVLILNVSVSGNVTCRITGSVNDTLYDGDSESYTGSGNATLTASGDFDHWRVDGSSSYSQSITIYADDSVHNVTLFGGDGDEPDPGLEPTFEAWMRSVSSDGTKVNFYASFENGDSSYSYQRQVRVTINGQTYTFYSDETGGSDSSFSDQITGLTPGTTYSWSATLYVRVSGGWSATRYTDSGRITTSGGSSGDGYVWVYSNGWKQAIPWIYNNGWKQAQPFVYNSGWKQGV